METYWNLKIDNREANVLLRLIAAANGAAEPEDARVGGYLADRIWRRLQERAEYDAGIEALRKSATP